MDAKNVDLSLYVITDPEVSGGRMHAEVVRLALEGGASVIQYRDKRALLRNQLDVGSRLRELTREHGALFIVNDRADLALALEADGVHLGPEDMPPDVVRRIVGPGMLIGVSVDNPEEAREAERDGADYILARPVYNTRWQLLGRRVMGAEGLAEIVSAVGVPVVGDGGINLETVPDVARAGAAGIGVTNAVVGAPEPSEAAGQLRRAFEEARQHSGAQA
jgi:thiamine-phosphate diphosphorylase